MAEEPKQAPEMRLEDASETQPALDAAGESLARALRLSFRILTVVIVLLIAIFFGKGFFPVQPDVDLLSLARHI